VSQAPIQVNERQRPDDDNNSHEIIRSMHKVFLLLLLLIPHFGVCQEQNPQNAAPQPLLVNELAFEVTGMGGTDILVRTSPTSKPKRLVRGINPTLSPDGQKIAYCERLGPTAFGQIQLLNMDGFGHTLLTKLKGGACPTDWSHDGAKIALTAYGAKTPLIFVMGKNGENLTQITAGYGARWSPDGKQLVFCRPAEGRGGSDSIWIANADGTGATKVIEDNSQVLEVAWFPDGKSIVFSSEREHKHRSALFRVNLDGTGLEPIVVDMQLSLFFPVPSPDGKEIVADAYPSGSGEGSMVLINLASHRMSVLVHGMHPSVLWKNP
jgi:Tol biopolymer transport system component